jgi:hypothetical protein
VVDAEDSFDSALPTVNQFSRQETTRLRCWSQLNSLPAVVSASLNYSTSGCSSLIGERRWSLIYWSQSRVLRRSAASDHFHR